MNLFINDKKNTYGDLIFLILYLLFEYLFLFVIYIFLIGLICVTFFDKSRNLSK